MIAINGSLWPGFLVFLVIDMEFQVARLQEIVNKIQYFSKLNFKNAVDVQILLEADGLEYDQINKLIGAGIKRVGFSSLEQYLLWENLLLPCKRHYLGDLEGQDLSGILANFDLIESVVSVEQARFISDLNAKTGKVSSILLKINILSEIKKYGVLPVEMNDVVGEIVKMSGLRLVGINSYVPELGNSKLVSTALIQWGVVLFQAGGDLWRKTRCAGLRFTCRTCRVRRRFMKASFKSNWSRFPRPAPSLMDPRWRCGGFPLIPTAGAAAVPW
jgi:uncharacterized pyridoxal phosphate-containing UPF0001 family protein